MDTYIKNSELLDLINKGVSANYKKVMMNRVTDINGKLYDYTMVIRKNNEIQYYYVKWSDTSLDTYKLDEVIPTPKYEKAKEDDDVNPARMLLYFIPTL